MTGFEPATTRPPDAYSNRAELHPALFSFAKVHKKLQKQTIFIKLFFCVQKIGYLLRAYSNKSVQSDSNNKILLPLQQRIYVALVENKTSFIHSFALPL